jgi:hypothetical protein
MSLQKSNHEFTKDTKFIQYIISLRRIMITWYINILRVIRHMYLGLVYA